MPKKISEILSYHVQATILCSNVLSFNQFRSLNIPDRLHDSSGAALFFESSLFGSPGSHQHASAISYRSIQHRRNILESCSGLGGLSGRDGCDDQLLGDNQLHRK